jgi:methylisocitrate lyase
MSVILKGREEELMNPVEKLREMVRGSRVILMPGVYDALSAKIAVQSGFELIFITGYSVSATLLGEPDFGLLTQTEMMDAARRVCSVVNAPVIVDADTGYGNAINAVRTVQELQRAGAAGLFLEDQVWPKRCGHMKGKKVISLEEQIEKIRASLDARGEGDLFLVARTDARQALGLEEAIRRGIAFKEAGADAVFIEAPESVDEMRKIADHVPPPLVANMIERGVTPLMTPEELRQLGFQLIVSPLSALFASALALQEVYALLKKHGTMRDFLERVLPLEEFHKIVGLEEKYELDRRYRVE